MRRGTWQKKSAGVGAFIPGHVLDGEKRGNFFREAGIEITEGEKGYFIKERKKISLRGGRLREVCFDIIHA